MRNAYDETQAMGEHDHGSGRPTGRLPRGVALFSNWAASGLAADQAGMGEGTPLFAGERAELIPEGKPVSGAVTHLRCRVSKP